MNIFKLFTKRDWIILLSYIAALVFAMFATPYIAEALAPIQNPFAIMPK